MFKKRKQKNREIAPDEIFLDSSNLPEFDTHQFEGRIEKPLSVKSIRGLGIFFIFIGILFMYRLVDLQMLHGHWYAERSARNHLRHTIIFPERGVIYDRNKTELAWNVPSEDEFFSRAYITESGFAHTLGYVSYPQKDKSGVYYQDEFVGKDGVEKYYDALLAGTRGLKITEVDVMGETVTEHEIENKLDGSNITLSVDARVQHALYTFIEELSERIGFSGGSAVLLDVNSGEILSMVSFPEYNPEILSRGENRAAISSYVNNKNTPFLNRVISGLYTPGSTVKPFMAIAALNEHLIDANKLIYSSGEISIPNPYFPEQKTVFKDWKAHGWVNMYDALAVSSNVYFYAIGGGYEDQQGLGIFNIEKYAQLFGLGEETGIDLDGEIGGVIPNPQWKADNFDGEEWRIGDTYHTAIGQYGFQITPLQLARGIAIIANGGKELTPHVLLDIDGAAAGGGAVISGTIPIDAAYFDMVKKGMRQAVTDGTASGLNVSYVDVAAKTGTAELGVAKELVNAWATGFFPYENPRYAFAVVMEKGPYKNLIGGIYIMRELLDWMNVHTPEYLK